ncbi:MAG: cytochrome c [Chitinophagaceae bacterium]
MNRQVNYIIYAVLLSLSLPIGYYFIDKIVSTEVFSNKQVSVSSVAPVAPPVMSESAAWGKILFNSKCASCHQIYKDATGPNFIGFEERGPWKDRTKLYAWIRNPSKFMETDAYTKGLKEKYGSMMTAFPDITDQEVDAIVNYINFVSEFHQYSSVVAD